MASYTVIVRLMAFDALAVEAETAEEVADKVRDILRNEQKYERRSFRPTLAEVESVREEGATAEIVWRRGEDPLKRLLVSGSG